MVVKRQVRDQTATVPQFKKLVLLSSIPSQVYDLPLPFRVRFTMKTFLACFVLLRKREVARNLNEKLGQHLHSRQQLCNNTGGSLQRPSLPGPYYHAPIAPRVPSCLEQHHGGVVGVTRLNKRSRLATPPP